MIHTEPSFCTSELQASYWHSKSTDSASSALTGFVIKPLSSALSVPHWKAVFTLHGSSKTGACGGRAVPEENYGFAGNTSQCDCPLFFSTWTRVVLWLLEDVLLVHKKNWIEDCESKKIFYFSCFKKNYTSMTHNHLLFLFNEKTSKTTEKCFSVT